jgi:periplasmic glucans biosynthesis protein
MQVPASMRRAPSATALVLSVVLGLPLGPVRAAGMDFDTVVRMAEELAGQPYQAPVELELPPMEYAQFHDVLFRPDLALWKQEALPFQVQFFPVGWIHKEGVTLYEVVDGEVEPMPLSTDMFTGARDLQGNAVTLPNAVSGFRLHGELSPGGKPDEFLVFMGASYFRALARGMGYGISARGVALNTAHPEGEEFPDFTTFWIVKPKMGDTTVTLYALLNGPSITGAYQLTAGTGERTTVAVRTALFLRRDVKQLGIAPLTSMFWYGENSYPRPQDYRPEVHDSDGLLIADGSGEWIWRPLLLSPAIRHTTFTSNALKGYGLLLRDRDFDHYQDLGAHNETRPSLWVEPVGDWGPGRVHLVEIPTNSEYQDNVVVFWEPAREAAAGTRFDLQYRLTWFLDDPALPPLGHVTATRRTSSTPDEHGSGTSSYRPYNHNDLQEFVVDFSPIPGVLNDEHDKPRIVFETSPGAEVQKSFVVTNPETGGWRVFNQVKFADEGRAVELNLKLVNDRNTLTEKWNYLWQP